MKLKFIRKEGNYFITWTVDEYDCRILKDKADKSFFPYSIQKYNGKTWDEIIKIHTLSQAKVFIKTQVIINK